MAQLTTQMTIAGNLTRDPELRYTQTGQAVASFSVASTPRSFNKETKEYEDGEAIFTNCTLWGKPAENFAASAVKGSRVIASGQLKTRMYLDKEQNPKTATDLVIDEIGMSVMFASYTKGGGVSKAAAAAETATTETSDDEPW
jgi:single-strand DNA-binding protein